jgi:phage-related minor tail protein
LFAKGAAFPQLALPSGVYTQPTYFPMPQEGPLKRYARGGVLGEAGPEAILPLRRNANGQLGVQGGGTEVVINNYTGEAVSRRTRQLGDREIVEIAIGQMEERIARGGNSTSRAFSQTYGVRRGR